MLVLTRKPMEEIRIGKDIVIKVIRTGRNTVKLGIDAPAEIRVMRMELIERDAEKAGESEEAAENAEASDLPAPAAEAATDEPCSSWSAASVPNRAIAG